MGLTTVNGLYYLVEYLKLQLLITGHRCECLAIWFLLIDLHEGIWAWQALNFLLALKLHDSSLWLRASVMTLCILDHEFHAWAPPSIAQNPKEQSATQGHTMTWRPGWRAILSPYTQEVFLTQGWNPSLLYLLHWQADSLPLCHLGIASPGGRNGNPLQYYCLKNFMDRGAW